MAYGYARLPEYETPKNALLDFSPINSAIEFDTNLRLKAAEEQRQQQRLGMEERRTQLAEESGKREGESHSENMRAKYVQRVAGIAQLIDQDPDPNSRAFKWQKMLDADPNLASKLPENARDPINGPKFLIAESRGYRDPLDTQAKQADIAAKNAQTGMYGAHTDLYRAQADVARQKPSDTFELGPDHARYQMVRNEDGTVTAREVARGPVSSKVDATTQKAIDEADDFILQTKGALGSIKLARQLSESAYSGAGAAGRAEIINNIPFVGGTKSARDTTDLQNVVTNQALQSLRATFGGNPTEGERKILLDVAGSVNQPGEVRARIFQRAEEAAQRRLLFNQQKAEALRANRYYKPGGQPSFDFSDDYGAAARQPQAAAPSQAIPRVSSDADFDALPSGARFVDPNGNIRRKP